MNWLRKWFRAWLYPNEVALEAGDDHRLHSPLVSMLGQASDRHYVAVPITDGFLVVSYPVGDPYSPTPTGQVTKVEVTCCRTVEEIGHTIAAKEAHRKLTAR